MKERFITPFILGCFLMTSLFVSHALALEDRATLWTAKRAFSPVPGLSHLRQRAAREGSAKNIAEELSAQDGNTKGTPLKRQEEAYLTQEELSIFRIIDAHFNAIYSAWGGMYLSDTPQNLSELLQGQGAGTLEAYALYEGLSPEGRVRFHVYYDHLLNVASVSRDQTKVVKILKKEDVARNLVGLLGTRNGRLKVSVVTYLPELNLDETLRHRAIVYLEKFVEDPSEKAKVREMSIFSLAELDPQRPDAYFQSVARNDPDESVKNAAETTLYQRSHGIRDTAHDGGNRRQEEPQRYHLNSLAEQSAKRAKHLEEGRKESIAISYEITQEPLYVNDRDGVTELFLESAVIEELIENAVKYTRLQHPLGGGVIKISLTHEGDDAVYRVQDNGIGIPDEEKEKVWNLGYRATNVRTKLPSPNYGEGKGLDWARRTVERYGGTIRFESKENEGTLFEVRLPLTKAAQKRYFGPERAHFETLTVQNQGSIFQHETAAYIQEILSNQASTVVLKNGEIIGYQLNLIGTYATGAPYLYVGYILVNPEYRLEGVARALFYQMAKEALARHIHRLQMEVHISTPGMSELAEQAGFIKAGVDKGMWTWIADPETVVQKSLSGYLEQLRNEHVQTLSVEIGRSAPQILSLDEAERWVGDGSLDFDLSNQKWVLKPSAPDGGKRYFGPEGIRYETLTHAQQLPFLIDIDRLSAEEAARQGISQVALTDGQVVGYQLNFIGRKKSYVELEKIKVADQNLRQGIGKALLFLVAKEAVLRDIPLLKMQIRYDNEASLGMAEKGGFQKENEKPDIDGYWHLSADPKVVYQNLLIGYLDYLKTQGIREMVAEAGPRFSLRASLDQAKELVKKGSLEFDLPTGKWLMKSAPDGGRRKGVTERKLGKATYAWTHPGRLKHLDDYMMEIVNQKPVHRVIDFGIGALVTDPYNTVVGPSATFFELEQKLHEKDANIELIGIDNRADVVEVNQNHLAMERKSDPDTLRNTEIFSGSFSEPVKRYPAQVDLIRAMNVFQHYHKKSERVKARKLLGQALREGGVLIEGQEGLFVTYEKRGRRLIPVTFHYQETPAPSFIVHAAPLVLDLDVAKIPHFTTFWEDLLAATLLRDTLVTDFFRDKGYALIARPNGLVSVSLESIPSKDGGRRAETSKQVTNFAEALDEFTKGEEGLEAWEQTAPTWDREAAKERFDAWNKWIATQQSRFIGWGRGSVVPDSNEAKALEPLMERFLRLSDRAALLFTAHQMDTSDTAGLAHIQGGNFYHFLLGRTDRAVELYHLAPETLRQKYFGNPLFGALQKAYLEKYPTAQDGGKRYFGPQGTKYATLTEQNRRTIFKDASLKGWSQTDIHRLLREGLSKVAVVDGRPVGYALNEKMGEGEFSYLHIGYLRTRENILLRRQGIARTLLYESAKEAVRQRLPLLQMEIHEDNHAMRALAESTGFLEKEKKGAFRILTARPQDVIQEIEAKVPSGPSAQDGGRRAAPQPLLPSHHLEDAFFSP